MSDPRRILLIDDNSEEYELLNFAIQKIGLDLELEVMFAQDCNTALRKLSLTEIDKFDTILLDWNMPMIAGAECLGFIKQIAHLTTTPIIVLSGNVHIKEKENAIQLGVAAFFNKPYSFEEYEDLLPKILKYASA